MSNVRPDPGFFLRPDPGFFFDFLDALQIRHLEGVFAGAF